MLDDAAVDELQKILAEDYGRNLSREESRELGEYLLKLFETTGAADKIRMRHEKKIVHHHTK